jgi:hypothetical protein
MKFEYDSKACRGEPVAYIDSDGDLRIKDRPSGKENVCLFQDGDTVINLDFAPDDPTNRHVFYPGDSITITF